MFKKDAYLFGSLLGLALMILSLLLIYLIMVLIGKADFELYYKPYLLAIIPNILLMRYYFKDLSMEKTAKAILFVSFILLVVYFYLQFKK